MTETPWQSRIVGYDTQRAGDLLANPRNWRIHPKYQQDVLAAVLSDVGWVQNIIVNQRSGCVVDGHMRVALALREQGEDAQIPVTLVDLDNSEELLILSTLDPIGSLAATDSAKIEELLRDVSTDDAALQQLLDELSFDVAPETIGAGGSNRAGVARAAASVKAVFSVPQLAVVEAAIAQTGEQNRGAALVAICEAYVEAAG